MHPVRQALDVAVRHGGPIATAVALGFASIVPVAVSLRQAPGDWQRSAWLPLSLPAALYLAACGVLAAAVVGGWAAGRIRARRPVAAGLVALAVSWPIAIAAIPVAAWMAGIRLRAAIWCFDACSPALRDNEPLGGAAAYLLVLVMGAFTLVPPAVALVLGLGARRAGRRLLAVVLLVLGYGALHVWSLLYGGLVAFGCLGAGVVAWSAWLAYRDRLLTPGTEAATPPDQPGAGASTAAPHAADRRPPGKRAAAPRLARSWPPGEPPPPTAR